MDQGAHSANSPEGPSSFCTVNVQVIVSLPSADNDSAKNSKNTFRIHGNEYPMSRFGSWVFRSSTDEASERELLNDGGLATVITWALFQRYNSMVTAWVSDCSKNRFVFEVKTGDQDHILGEISAGNMATTLEEVLRSLSNPRFCENVQIKLIKIIQNSGKKTQADPGNTQTQTPMDSESFDQKKIERLHQTELVARHMKSKQYSWALSSLKQHLAQENDESYKLQVLIRIYICAAHLENKKEMEECLPRLVMAMKLATIPPQEISLYTEEYRDLLELLVGNGATVRALEVGFAFQHVIAKIPDVTTRLETRTNNIQQLCKAITSLLKSNPGVCLKAEARSYIKRVHDEIDSMKKETYCDTLVQAQCVYYSEFALAEVRKLMDRRIAEVFNDASVEFKRLCSCWGDFPFVFTRLRKHPEVSKYLADEEYIRKLRKISMKPSILEKHLKDPKIVLAHEVLSSEFGLLDDIVMDDSANNDVSENTSNNGLKNDEPTPPVDNKAEARREKELGNDAYKNFDFVKAHEHYDKALHYDPNDALLHSNKAAVYISQGNLAMAKRACIAAMEVAKTDETRFTSKDTAKFTARLAKAEFLDARRDLALLLYQQSLAINPDPKVFEEMRRCQESILNNASGS